MIWYTCLIRPSNGNIKDTLHVIFTCPRSTQVWSTSNLWANVEQATMDFDTLAEIGFSMLQRFQPPHLSLFDLVLWSL
jgi:hypothetical protein